MFNKLKFFYRYKIKFKHKFIIWSIIVLMLLSCVAIYFEKRINPVIITMSEARINSLASTAVYNAIGEVISGNILYTDLIKIQTGSDGSVDFIQANGLAINALGNRLAYETQNNLDNMGQQTVNIPLGNFSGMPILVGQGPKVQVKLLPIGTVVCTFKSEFSTAGINQTNHKIFMYANTRINMVLPTASKTITNVVEVLICESIIVGAVPDTYLNSTDLDTMLNLI